MCNFEEKLALGTNCHSEKIYIFSHTEQLDSFRMTTRVVSGATLTKSQK